MALKQESKLIKANIREVLSGKSSAYEQLYTVHTGRIYNFGLKYYDHSRQAAEELTRRVFINAFEQINTYPDNITFILWLRKLAVEEIKTGKIKKADEVHQVSPVDDAVFSLPEEERIIFILSDMEKLTVEEIVEVVNNSPDDINAKLESARKRMMESLNVENLKDLDYKINFVSKKTDPRDELWDSIYNHIHTFATKDLKEEDGGDVLNVGDAKLTLGEKIEKLKQEKKKKEVFLKPLGLTISRKAFYTFFLVLLVIAAALYLLLAKQTKWDVVSLSGSPTIKGNFRNIVVEGSTSLESNEFLTTDQTSKAVIKIPETAEIYLNPGSTVKKNGGNAEITLNSGLIDIVKPAGSEPFIVDVHSVMIEDYKNGSYSVKVNKSGAEIYANSGSLILTSGERKVYLIPLYVCEVRPKGKIGLPYMKSSSKDLINAINSFSFDGDKEKLNIILLLSDRRDALTLFNVLPEVDKVSREMVINKLHSLVSIPEDINPRQLSDLNEEDLRRWLDQIEQQINKF